MDSAQDMGERHGAALQELAALGLDLARDLQARARASRDDAAAERLAIAFHRVSRSVRMTLSLEARLAQEVRAVERDGPARRRHLAPERRVQVKAAVTRQAWESEAEDPEALLEDLDARLSEEGLFDSFIDDSLDDVVARICRDLGIPPCIPAQAGTQADSPPDPVPAGILPDVGMGGKILCHPALAKPRPGPMITASP